MFRLILFIFMAMALALAIAPSGHNRVLRLLPAPPSDTPRAVIVFELSRAETTHIDFHYTKAPRGIQRLRSRKLQRTVEL